MTYKNISELSTAFLNGNITKLDNDITVSDIVYSFSSSNTQSTEDILNGTKLKMVYSLNKKKSNVEEFDKQHVNADDPGVQDRLVFVWSVDKLHVVPTSARFIANHRVLPIKEAQIKDDKIITYNEDIILRGINQNKKIAAKVDTGASMSSIDAANISINKEMVSFEFEGNSVAMSLHGYQSIKTAGSGVEQRPMVSFDVTINGVVIKNVRFNLNDRSNMPDKILLGQNFIKAGDFVVVANK